MHKNFPFRCYFVVLNHTALNGQSQHHLLPIIYYFEVTFYGLITKIIKILEDNDAFISKSCVFQYPKALLTQGISLFVYVFLYLKYKFCGFLQKMCFSFFTCLQEYHHKAMEKRAVFQFLKAGFFPYLALIYL